MKNMKKMANSFFLFITLTTTISFTSACNSEPLVEVLSPAAAAQLRAGMTESSANLGRAVHGAADKMSGALRDSAKELRLASVQLGQSIERGAKELGKSIEKVSDDLVRIADKVTNSIDKGVAELGEVMREAVAATKEITNTLTASIDKAVVEVGKQLEHATNTVRAIVSDLTDSIDNGVKELGETVRYLADKFAEIAKQVDIRVDSGDLVRLANETGNALRDSIEVLTKNWDVSVKSADLKDVGAAAAEQLKLALQDMNLRVKVEAEIGDNLRRAVLYVAIAGGIAMSVLCVALVISLKGCRSCCMNLFTVVIDRIGRERQVESEHEDRTQTSPKRIRNFHSDGKNKKMKGRTVEDGSDEDLAYGQPLVRVKSFSLSDYNTGPWSAQRNQMKYSISPDMVD